MRQETTTHDNGHKYTSVRLTVDSLEALEAIAKKERRTRNWMIQRAIDFFLAENPNKNQSNK